MASNEYQATSSQASSSSTNPTSDSNNNSSVFNSLVFNKPIKLTNNNYLLWRSQIIATINANGLENLIDNIKNPPNRVIINVNGDQIVVTSPNPQFQIWRRND